MWTAVLIAIISGLFSGAVSALIFGVRSHIELKLLDKRVSDLESTATILRERSHEIINALSGLKMNLALIKMRLGIGRSDSTDDLASVDVPK